MKLPQRLDSVAGQFEGRTPEEAVRMARAEFGSDAPVRCWKTRTGGVLGFFAREAFVAGITPPAGAIKAVKTPRAARELTEAEAPEELPAKPRLAPPIPDRESLSLLVEETNDELTLGSAPVPAAVFSEVLAEAQAAVNGADVGAHLQWPPSQNALTALASPERIEGLNESLASIGVPPSYRPQESEATLDGLARVLATLPVGPDRTHRRGIGARRGRCPAGRAGGRPDTLGPVGAWPLPICSPSDRTDAGRQKVARRRSSNKVTVVVVEASLRSRDLAVASSWIEQVEPDYVLGAVAATAKRADVEQWRARVGRLDALALSRLGNTASPGELMGLLPIAFLDREEASTVRWVLTLLRTTLARQQ